MYGIDVLVAEHELIKDFLDRMDKRCEAVLEGKEINIGLFKDAVAFIREFADGYHHHKEEDILFDYMIRKLGPIGESLVRNGMLVEHDLARLSVKQLDEALDEYSKTGSVRAKLDILANMTNYAYILRRHIEKENGVCYPFAQSKLEASDLDDINAKTLSYEEKEENVQLREKYLAMLEKF